MHYRRQKPWILLLCAALCALAPLSHAQASAKQRSILSIQASQAAAEGDYRTALQAHHQLIILKPKNATYYVQRGLLYRQMKQIRQSQQDAHMVLQLVEPKLQNASSNRKKARYYWQRAQAHRLLLDYDTAIRDIRYAMRLKRNNRWMPDRQAIELEAKMYDSGRPGRR